ncbi:MAG TPA: AI-2E family transporter [Bacteroidales bacterium]|nr:AI-2E family transporter [Bacteroidales bacterium]
MKTVPLSKINNFLFFLVLLVLCLYYGKEILIPIVFSVFLAMLMAPVSNKLENWGVSRVFSTLISLLIIIVVISLVLFLFTAQIVTFTEDLPEIQKRMEEFISGIQEWVKTNFGISPEQQMATIKEQAKNTITSAGSYLTGMITGLVSFIGAFTFVLVFTFLFLLHREKYENFFVLLYKDEKRESAKVIISNISKIVQKYLAGRAISILLLTVFYTIGLLILGIKNAFLLSAIAAIATIIPYVGPIVGGMMPFLMAVIYEDSFGPALGVIVVISLAQLFDNYFIEPYVVGGNVNISPFFTIFILILGGTLWGIAGIILFLPLLGMLKIVFDNVEGLYPYAYLIGDQNGSSEKKSMWSKVKGVFNKKNAG